MVFTHLCDWPSLNLTILNWISIIVFLKLLLRFCFMNFGFEMYRIYCIFIRIRKYWCWFWIINTSLFFQHRICVWMSEIAFLNKLRNWMSCCMRISKNQLPWAQVYVRVQSLTPYFSICVSMSKRRTGPFNMTYSILSKFQSTRVSLLCCVINMLRDHISAPLALFTNSTRQYLRLDSSIYY